MVLFDKDRKKYKHLIYDWKTPNKSFVQLASIYKLMNVKNHAFILALHNPALVGVDPHDPNLSRVKQNMVIKECFQNPWYFFREVVKAPPLAGSEPNPFRANRGNISTLWLFFNHVMTLLIQPRQTGKSFTVDSLMTGLLNVWCMNTKINLLTKDEKLRSATVVRVKEIITYLPEYLILRTAKDNDNGESIKLSLPNNEYNTHVAQSSEKAAFNAARGLSSPIMHIDEFAYFKHIATALPAALPATGAAMEDARRKDQPHGVLLTTTAGWLDSPAGAYAYDFYTKASVWSEHYYDFENLKAFKRFLRTDGNSDNETVIIDMNHRQLGFTDQWLKRRINESLSTEGKAETDFLNIWASGSSASPFDKKVLKGLKQSIKSDPRLDIGIHNYALRWYFDEKEMLDERLVMGLDTSDAVGNDDIALVIRRISDGSTVAVGEYNETNTISFAKWISELLLDFRNMTLIIERRSSGTSILDYIMKFLSVRSINPYTRVFSWIIDEAKLKPDRLEMVLNYGLDESIQDKFRKEIGFATAASGRASRNKLYGEALQESMEFTHTKVYDKKLVGQISKLMIKKGRMDHDTGEKDDLVIAWLLGFWFMSRAKNVEYYGYVQTEMLSEMGSDMYDVEDDRERKRIEDYKDELNRLFTKLDKMKDLALIKITLRKIERIKSKLPEDALVQLNIEKVIKDIMRVKRTTVSSYNFNERYGLPEMA